jgi:PAS domain S-box-containing protein
MTPPATIPRGPAWIRERPGEWAGLLPALLFLALVTLLDIRLGSSVTLTGVLAVGPFITALSGARRATVVVAVTTVVLATASGLWNHDFNTSEYLVRLPLVIAASAFACYSAWVISYNRRAARGLELLNEVAGAADGSVPLAATLDRITTLAVPELADLCMVDVISDDRVERVAVRAAEPRRSELESRIAAREPSLPTNILEGTKQVLEPRFKPHMDDQDLRAMARGEEDLELLRAVGVRSFITVALSSRGRRIGAMTLVHAWSGRRQSRADLRFAQLFADRVALALDNAGLFSDLESVERRMDSVMAVLDEAVAINDSNGELIFANQAAVELAGCASLEELFELVRSGAERFEIYDEWGEPLDRSDTEPRGEPEEPGTSPRILRVHRTEDGTEKWLRVRSSPVLGPEGQPIYTVSVFEDVTEMKLAEFAQSVLARTGELLTSSTDPNRMLARLVELLVPRLADLCSAHLPDAGDTLPMVAIAHRDPGKAVEFEQLMRMHPLRLDELTGTGAGTPQASQPMRELGIESRMIVPLRAGEDDQVIGALDFANRTGRRPFDDLDRRIAHTVAGRVAPALENARIASERSEIAETLQKGLQPARIPEIPGWSIAALYRPAGSENQAGGDFYDLFRIEGGWMVVIGDVTGHGARAASVTAMARYTIQTAATLTGDPLNALEEVNRALLGRAGGALCSVAAITLDQPPLGRVAVAVAGHPPPLLVSDASEIREIKPPGPVLGAFEDAEWGLESLQLSSGEQLVLYTDGVTEAEGPTDRFGETRLRDRLREASTASEAATGIEQALDEFCDGEARDDAAFLAIMRNGGKPLRPGGVDKIGTSADA